MSQKRKHTSSQECEQTKKPRVEKNPEESAIFLLEIVYAAFLDAKDNNKPSFRMPVKTLYWDIDDEVKIEEIQCLIDDAVENIKKAATATRSSTRFSVPEASDALIRKLYQLPSATIESLIFDLPSLRIHFAAHSILNRRHNAWPKLQRHIEMLYYANTYHSIDTDMISVSSRLQEVESISTIVPCIPAVMAMHNRMTKMRITGISEDTWPVYGLQVHASLTSLDLQFTTRSFIGLPIRFLDSILSRTPNVSCLTLRDLYHSWKTDSSRMAPATFGSIQRLRIISTRDRSNPTLFQNKKGFLNCFPAVQSLYVDHPHGAMSVDSVRELIRLFPRLRILSTVSHTSLAYRAEEAKLALYSVHSNVLVIARPYVPRGLITEERERFREEWADVIPDLLIHNAAPFALLQQWMRISTLVSFYRANISSPFRNSIMAVLPSVIGFVGPADRYMRLSGKLELDVKNRI